MKRKHQLALGLAAALTLVVAIGILLSSRDDDSRPPAYGRPVGDAFQSGDLNDEEKRLVEQLGPNVHLVRMKPLLQELSVEKPRVCPGEDVLLRAVERAPLQSLRFVIMGEIGPFAVVRWNVPGEKKLFAVAREYNEGIDYKMGTVTVLEGDSPECAQRPQIVLEAKLSTLSDHADLHIVQVRGLGSKLRLFWDFGDGSKAEGADRFVRHNYFGRREDGYASSYLVSVRAVDEAGREARARASVSFINTHYLARLTGNPIMPVQYNRFPTRTASGFETVVQFANIEPESVRLAEASVGLVPCRPGEIQTTTRVPADRLLGEALIPAARRHATRLRLPESLATSACQAVIEFSSADTTPDGRTIRAFVNLELQPPESAPGPNAAFGRVKVDDPVLNDELAQATKILGRSTITPEDLELLRKQGKLKPAPKATP